MMNFSRKLPIGVQSFKVLRDDNYLYVDKTEYVYRLVSSGRVYFLSRPRRFGKSLFLSTLEAYFLGQKELFKGLAIEKLEESEKENRETWLEYPVLYLDLNLAKYETREDLESVLNNHLCRWEELYDKSNSENTLAERFFGIIHRAYKKTGKQSVILIDEYDKPLLHTMWKDAALNEIYKTILKGFFGVIKTADQAIRFAFLTGVTKFSKVSIFSDLNNLNDISINPEYSAICGISQKELVETFRPEIETLAEKNELSYEDCVSALKKRYDGYCFSYGTEMMYNPFSLLNVFFSKQFEDYWFATGTPTFLVNELKRADYNIPDLDGNVEMNSAFLSDYRAGVDSIIPVLFQSGYLTIKGYDKEYKMYLLGFPNEEVRYGFLYNLLPEYSNINFTDTSFNVVQFTRDLRAGKVDEFMQRLKSIMASLPYGTEKKDSNESIALREHNFQVCIYLVFALMGQFVEVETPSSTGRTDCVVKTEKAVYVFEFKLKESAEDALKQIKEKNYTERYKAENKNIVLIGVSFDSEEKTVKEWISETLT
ncbi:AAA family ATPase [Treponema denticola]|nr:AAA family ATPase [Treponema denticola]